MKKLNDILAENDPDYEPASEKTAKRFNELWIAQDEVLSRDQILLQAKALVVCALPYKRTSEPRITRKARIGRHERLSVTFSAVGEGAELPFGADRAVLGWIQTRAFHNGFVEYDTLREFLDDFGLNDSGANYQRFRQRVERLSRLAISIELETGSESAIVNLMPVKQAFFPKSEQHVKKEANLEGAGQMLMIPKRYGFQLDEGFWQYLRGNPVPLPLKLMRLFHSRPKGWDLAQFVLWRCYAAKKPSVIPWDAFRLQMGSADGADRQLRRTLRKYLAEIKVVYPDLPAEFLDGKQGMRVSHWQPPVAEKRRRRLPQDRRS